ncbi:hypothetical protein [Streptomyces griseomycini]|uniref:DUF8129 domain-containing protein n=1 Tax=Streptomyces griseomycini TaxID=66895 RepID=A0A7W7PWD7_9ACTN|nr:hypothetical protein [Streptomyces griseomycini]MBB4902456.1 hypothetical protein [Streptomyces griseomycini]GGR46394.1 hypothetical protein GCM10015536_60250 [Streptomyces griseomycini]
MKHSEGTQGSLRKKDVFMSEEKNETGMPPHEALPLPDYDHLPLSSLQHRIRTLDEKSLREVLAYEEAHGNRLPVMETLRHRLRELSEGAEPSGGSPLDPAPEHAPPADSGSPVSPVTSGPPINPPSHGAPENPAQPRSTG